MKIPEISHEKVVLRHEYYDLNVVFFLSLNPGNSNLYVFVARRLQAEAKKKGRLIGTATGRSNPIPDKFLYSSLPALSTSESKSCSSRQERRRLQFQKLNAPGPAVQPGT